MCSHCCYHNCYQCHALPFDLGHQCKIIIRFRSLSIHEMFWLIFTRCQMCRWNQVYGSQQQFYCILSISTGCNLCIGGQQSREYDVPNKNCNNITYFTNCLLEVRPKTIQRRLVVYRTLRTLCNACDCSDLLSFLFHFFLFMYSL